MNRQLETLESRYCLSSPVQMHGGDFVRHERHEFHVASFNSGGTTTATATKVEQTVTDTKTTFAWSSKIETRRFDSRDGFERGDNRIGGAMNRADGPAANTDYVGPGGHFAPPSIIFIRVLPGSGGEIVVIPDGKVVAWPGTGGAVSGGGTVSADSNPGATESKSAKHIVETQTDTTPIDEQKPDTATVADAVTEARPVVARAAQMLSVRAADLFADADPVASRGPILASGSSALAGRAANFAAAAIHSVATQWNERASVAQIARTLAGRILPIADAVINGPLATTATNAARPVMETLASAMSAPAAAVSYEIVHLGSPFMLLADSVASFVEESAAVPNALAQAKSNKPWGLTFTVLAADLAVVSYVYRRKKTSRRVALAHVGM